MNRRDFHKKSLLLGAGMLTGASSCRFSESGVLTGETYREPPKDLPVRHFDVVVSGGGTAGVVAALAAARNGAKTMLIEMKGYPGGAAVEGGTGLHSFFNVWMPFGVEKRQVVKGIAEELVDRLVKIGGSSGFPEMTKGFARDCVGTIVDTELYKLVAMRMLDEAGVVFANNTFSAGAITDGGKVLGVITETHAGREAVMAKAFIDSSGYGDLAAAAGAQYTILEDYDVCGSFGMANIDIEQYHDYLEANGGVGSLCFSVRSGEPNKIVRMSGGWGEDFKTEARKISMSSTVTTVHDNYATYVKCNYWVPGSILNRDDMAKAELELRNRLYKAVGLYRKYVPGCEKAAMVRVSPSISIRRGRLIICDYDLTHEDVIEGRHFDDDVFSYGYHDSAPIHYVNNGGTYGLPYRAIRVAGLDNLFAAGMLITSDRRAHQSTRNTVSCMAQGQAAGTAAALIAKKNCGSRDLEYGELRDVLVKDNVYLEN